MRIRSLRMDDWAGSKIPFLMLGAIAVFLVSGVTPEESVLPFVCFSVLSVAIMISGYVANDFSDVEQDRAVGKSNMVSTRSMCFSYCSLLLATVPVLIPIFVFPSIPMTIVVVTNLFLSTSYSLRPIRFKERGLMGVIVSSYAQRCSPLTVLPLMIPVNPVILSATMILGFALGVRYILIHQSMDHDNDVASKTKTFFGTHQIASKRGIYICIVVEWLATSCIVMILPTSGWPINLVILMTSLAVELFTLRAIVRSGLWPFFDYTYLPLTPTFVIFLPLAILVSMIHVDPIWAAYLVPVFLFGSVTFFKALSAVAGYAKVSMMMWRSGRLNRYINENGLRIGRCIFVGVEPELTDEGTIRSLESLKCDMMVISPLRCSVRSSDVLSTIEQGECARLTLRMDTSHFFQDISESLSLSMEEFYKPGMLYIVRTEDVLRAGFGTPLDVIAKVSGWRHICSDKSASLIGVPQEYEKAVERLWGMQAASICRAVPEVSLHRFPAFLSVAVVLLALFILADGAIRLWASASLLLLVVTRIVCVLIMYRNLSCKIARIRFLRGFGLDSILRLRLYSFDEKEIVRRTVCTCLSMALGSFSFVICALVIMM